MFTKVTIILKTLDFLLTLFNRYQERDDSSEKNTLDSEIGKTIQLCVNILNSFMNKNVE